MQDVWWDLAQSIHLENSFAMVVGHSATTPLVIDRINNQADFIYNIVCIRSVEQRYVCVS